MKMTVDTLKKIKLPYNSMVQINGQNNPINPKRSLFLPVSNAAGYKLTEPDGWGSFYDLLKLAIDDVVFASGRSLNTLPSLKIVDETQEISDGDSETFSFAQTLPSLYNQGYRFLWVQVKQLNSSDSSCVTIPLSELLAGGSSRGATMSIMGPGAHTLITMDDTEITFSSVTESFDEQIVVVV